MSGTVAANTLNSIYNNTFSQYLRYSGTIGGAIFEQSLNVDNVFKNTLDLVQNFSRYRKPANPLAEQCLTDQLFREISEVKAFESKTCEHVFEITLVSKSVRVFEWIKEVDVERFIHKLHKYVQFYQQKAQCEIEHMGRTHFEWLKHWNETYEELSIFVVNFFKTGIVWSGNATLPLSHVLGDSQKPEEHQSSQNENSKGDEVHQTPSNISKDSSLQRKIFEKQGNKWLIQNQKDSHKDLLLNTARKDDTICICNCEDCTTVIENHVETVHLDMCKRVTVLFRNASRFEAADCYDCNVHCFEKIPDLDMQNCQNCGIYLSDKSLDSSVITTKCIGIYVHFPFEDGIYHSFKISDQLKTTIITNKGIETAVR